MTAAAHSWAIGCNDIEHASEVRDEVIRLDAKLCYSHSLVFGPEVLSEEFLFHLILNVYWGQLEIALPAVDSM
jgi:hypothetical protein